MDKRHIEVAIKAAKTSGVILVDYFRKVHDFRQKNRNIRDLVTEVDILSEKNIKKEILAVFPDHSIAAEESQVLKKDRSMVWHIDPLDGTVNYSQGITLCAVSIALEIDGNIAAGVIFNPFSDELFYAIRGGGAFLNGRPITVSGKNLFRNGLYVAAFSSSAAEEKSCEYEVFGQINDTSRGVLRIGSAALALAYLSCGRIDGFWAKNLFPWDLAAGLVIVQEAGGRCSGAEGDPVTLESPIFVASNGTIHDQLLGKLKGLQN